jgi:O-antigen ligase
MTTTRSYQPAHGAPVVAPAILLAGAIGVVLARDVRTGIALLLAGCFLGVLVVDLPLALALWTPLVFLDAIPALNLAGKAAGFLIFLAAAPRVLQNGAASAMLRRHRVLLATLVSLLIWLALSALWASDPGAVLGDLWHWFAVAALFLAVAASIKTEQAARRVAAAFVIGGALSVGVGVLSGHLTTASTAVVSNGVDESRLGGGSGNPNVLAAGLVPAIVLAAALVPGIRAPLLRLGLLVLAAVLAFGVAASESRGAMIAALVAIVASFVVFRRQRLHVLAVTLVIGGVMLAWFAASPAAWHRVTSFNNGGSGRTDTWRVAWTIFERHPVGGVGLNNFGVVAKDYVRDSGPLTRVDLIAEHPHVVHNTYLQLLAENGMLACILFVMVTISCIAAGMNAARRSGRFLRYHAESLAVAVAVGVVAMLAADFFGSGGVDRRLWILLALGPALLGSAPAATNGQR